MLYEASFHKNINWQRLDDNFRQYRRQAGLSAQQVAGQLDVCTSAVIKMENANNAPSLKHFLYLCDALHVSYSVMLEGVYPLVKRTAKE